MNLFKYYNDESILNHYYGIYENAKKDIELDGKSLQQACLEHPSLYLYYYDKLCELKKLSTDVQIELDKLRSKHTIRFNENHSIDLGLSLINKYIESESEIVKAKQTLAEVDELKNKFEAIKEAFISRSFQLNNVTKQRVAMVEEGLL